MFCAGSVGHQEWRPQKFRSGAFRKSSMFGRYTKSQLRIDICMKSYFSGTQKSTILWVWMAPGDPETTPQTAGCFEPRLLEWFLGPTGPSRPPKLMISGSRKNRFSRIYRYEVGIEQMVSLVSTCSRQCACILQHVLRRISWPSGVATTEAPIWGMSKTDDVRPI